MQIKSILMVSALSALMLSVGCSSDTTTPSTNNDAAPDTNKPDTNTTDTNNPQDMGADTGMQSLADFIGASTNPSFKDKLLKALQQTNNKPVLDKLTDGNKYTIFAPVDGATKWPADLNATAVADVLKSHVITGVVDSSKVGTTCEELTTLNPNKKWGYKKMGDKVLFYADKAACTANGTTLAETTKLDIFYPSGSNAGNATIVIHAISEVLM